MPPSSLQTQCPNCQTRFRVSDEQLGIAKGKVRCGNCMAVFNAIEHQVKPGAPADNSPEPAEKADAPADAGPSNFTEEDFVFQDNPEEDATEGQYAGTKLGFSDDELSDSFRDIDESSGPSAFHDDHDDGEFEHVDESWAEDILSEPDHAPQGKPAPEPKAPEPARESLNPAPSQPEAAEPQRTTEQPHFKEKPSEDSFFIEIEENDEPVADVDSQSAQPEAPMSAAPPFKDLRREPVSVGDGGSGKLRTFFWSLIVLALIGVLVAQVTWYQFDRLSAIPELRPFYEKGCEFAGCELKPLVNVGEIQSRKLVVRSDPDNRNQLIVDAVIINRAEFEQPFPAIALTFSNLNGDIVAQSVFTPDEYLAGEGRNLEAMPRETPVRIAIQIRDPGRDAVNYNINFRPNNR